MMEKKGIAYIPYLLLVSILILFLSTHSANVGYDSPSYIHFGPTRPFLYPLFIWLFHWMGQYQFSMVIWVQGILLVIALLYARNWLLKNLQIFDFSIFLAFLFIILTISLHFQVWYVQSEGLSFPIFIFTFFVLIECFQQYHLKKVIYLALLTSLLVLARLQFYYFYGIFLILCIWYCWQRLPVKLIVTTVVILFGSMLLTFLIDHGYHYFKHGFFGGDSYGQTLFLGQTLYLADNDAANYFQNTQEREYVQHMIDLRNTNPSNQDALLLFTLKPSYFEYAYQSYVRNFDDFQKIIANTLKMNDQVINFDSLAIALHINKILFLHDVKRHMLFFIWKFVKCMGGIPIFLFYFILLFAIIIKIIKDKIRHPDLGCIFIGTILIITFCNAAIIALCNPDLPPYFCYTQFMFYCLAGFLASKACKLQ